MERTGDLAAAARRAEAARGPEAAAAAAAARGAQPPRARAVGNQTFLTGAAFVSSELDQLVGQVGRFVKEAQRRHDDTGVLLAQSSEEVKRRLDTVSKALQGLDRVVAAGSAPQLRKHYGTILDTLRKRFHDLGKTFEESFRERTKALSSKQAEQAKRFGASKVQLAAPRRPAPVIMRPGASPTAAPQPSSGGLGPGMPSPSGLGGGGMRRRGGAGEGGGGGGGGGGVLPRPGQQPRAPGALPPAALNAQPYDPNAPAYAQSKKHDDGLPPQQQGGRMAQYDRATFRQRQKAVEMQNVETMITEVSQMFGKVAHLVAEQGSVVQRIDEDLDVAKVDIDAGQSELLKYYTNLSGERAFILKIFAVTLCLGIFFIVYWR